MRRFRTVTSVIVVFNRRHRLLWHAITGAGESRHVSVERIANRFSFYQIPLRFVRIADGSDRCRLSRFRKRAIQLLRRHFVKGPTRRPYSSGDCSPRFRRKLIFQVARPFFNFDGRRGNICRRFAGSKNVRFDRFPGWKTRDMRRTSCPLEMELAIDARLLVRVPAA